jgi:GntR family transcriptional regulator, rspAB operon transcriptional repressor
MTSEESLPKESLVESIARDLREQILSGRLSPGRRISQLSLAEHYGVSRLPVREALRALSSDGLVVMEPARGARVAALDGDDLREVYLLRERLEPLVVSLAIDQVTERDVREAESLLRGMDDPQTPDDEWLRLDRQFHTMWYDLVKMPRLIRTVDQLWDVAQRYRGLSLMTPGSAGTSNREHWLLLDSIRRRAADDAEAVLEVHIRRTRVILESWVPTALRPLHRAERAGDARRPAARGQTGPLATGGGQPHE